ncbi:MAG: hypothetical protein ABEK50_00875 [bacterium]
MVSDEILEDLDLDFSSDQAAEESMKEYIRENFSDVLGDKIDLLDAPNGLELLLQEVQKLKEQAGVSETESAQVA